MRERGFTLLEVLVATTIMAIAVVGLLSAVSTSVRNAARLTDHDRSALFAQRKMDELLADPRLPRSIAIEGAWDRESTGLEGGWRARVSPFDVPPGAVPGAAILERIQLEVWWKSGAQRRSLSLEGFRRGKLYPGDAVAGAVLE